MKRREEYVPSYLKSTSTSQQEEILPHDRILIEHTLTTSEVWEELRKSLGDEKVVLLNTCIGELCDIEIAKITKMTQADLLRRRYDSRWKVYREVSSTVAEFKRRMYERLTRVVLDEEDSELLVVDRIYNILDVLKD